jgi:hypothetical protein
MQIAKSGTDVYIDTKYKPNFLYLQNINSKRLNNNNIVLHFILKYTIVFVNTRQVQSIKYTPIEYTAFVVYTY